ncbi:PREDICTED: lysine-specific demethylase 8 [Dinoponera quadriceps]|uniref:Lysine-specific demethylase 8 n=1 Tax=Dinoponera quadriceps TaxID=609295 RepID=A0A6P3XVV3_DINQU|nr:PREDICTED: lysine-specific demethylase 8 [Dinoponera quadriceps]XP_014482678.1 PREDICTED: lysine-specific demethylase 8 [Dinoponera quadriceps]XP_014482679.1 PREDICTED: lysine-specific demethylase 8 [Dinoponera quadriceps]XP_014482680.1 PREDICTED: lysine-specific demethylase 8 [Dinoponera quadriceps]XP_014482681.1 PREDICTED: lysine-specific demethylase 8 [Dinoponera quadriceps]
MARSTSMVTVPWELLAEELKNIPIEIRLYLASTIDVLRASDKQLTSEKWIGTSITKIEACLDRTWEMLNSGYWKDVPVEYRYSYSLCIVIKAVLLELQYEINAGHSTEKEKKAALRNIISQIDKGILLGAPLSSVPNLLTTIAAKLNSYCGDESSGANLEEIPIDGDKINDAILSGFSEVAHYEEPSMESFYRKVFMPKYPAVLTGCMKHWKALALWKNPDYLCKIAGSRTVPIEIGSRYTEEDWTQHLVSFSEFLRTHVIASDSRVGYLAQHQLFEQIPELKEDFAIPEYCSFSDDENNDVEPPDINAWFGPGGTVSPLHFDPKNNLLSQIFGYKRIILYHPDETDNLYPYNTRLLNNTAQVDPINLDYNKWPNFCKAKGLMCCLKPGEMLYIPPKWWHHVTALTPSFSISFWWS